MPMLTINLVLVLILVGWNQDLKVIARCKLDGTMSFHSKKAWEEHTHREAVVIRNEEELVVACHVEGKIINPAQRPNEILATQFKVDKIDWQTQMVVVIDVGSVEDTSLEIRPLTVKGWELSLNYVLHHKYLGRRPPIIYLGEMLLVERIDGEFQFKRTLTFSGNPNAK